MDRREKNQKTETEKYFGRTETKTIKSGKQETKRKTVGRTYRKTKTEKGKRKKHLPKKIRNRPKTGNFFDLYKKYFGIIKNGLEETLRYRYRRFAKMGLETSVVCRFDTGPIFIDTDGSTCHPPEYHHNQGVNLSSVIFAIFSRSCGLRIDSVLFLSRTNL